MGCGKFHRPAGFQISANSACVTGSHGIGYEFCKSLKSHINWMYLKLINIMYQLWRPLAIKGIYFSYYFYSDPYTIPAIWSVNMVSGGGAPTFNRCWTTLDQFLCTPLVSVPSIMCKFDSDMETPQHRNGSKITWGLSVFLEIRGNPSKVQNCWRIYEYFVSWFPIF